MTSYLNIFRWQPTNRIKGTSVALLLGLLPLLVFAAIHSYLLYILAGSAAIMVCIGFIRDARVRFVLTLSMIFVLKIAPAETEIAILGYSASAIFIGGIIISVLKRKILSKTSLTHSHLFTWFALYLVWTLGIGLLGVVDGTVNFLLLSKEFLILTPLFLLPIYYSEIVDLHLDAERFLSACMIVLWIAVFIAAGLKIRQNLVQAIYLFEIGVARYDSLNGGFMMFVFLSLAMIGSIRRRWFLYFGFFISIVSLILTFGRSVWIGTAIFLPVVLFLGNRVERKGGYRFIVTILFGGGVIIALGYLFIPAVQIGVLFILSKLLSASNLHTDASMYNRYVEWEHILKYIFSSPITGYGFGATFADYVWISGYTTQTGYTHSAYLSILFKSGIVGAIFLFIPYIGFLVRGLKYIKSVHLTERERAYLRVGIALMLNVTLLGYTGNIFFQREMSMYIALYWCYCIQIERKLLHRENSTVI